MAGEFSMRVKLTIPARDAETIARDAAILAKANGKIAKALTLGLQMLTFQAQKERFTGSGPFPVAANRLGNISGRLKRDLHAETVEHTPTGYQGKIGSAVEYFGAHEVGFEGDVSVRAHTRAAHTLQKRNMSRLEQSVRSHKRHLKIPARRPLRTAIEEHAETIIGGQVHGAITRLLSSSL